MARKVTFSDMPEEVLKIIIEAGLEGHNDLADHRLLGTAEGVSRNLCAAARAVAGEQRGLRDVDVRELLDTGSRITGDFPAPAKLSSFLLWLRKRGPRLRSLTIEIGGLSRKDTVLLLGVIVNSCEQLEILHLYSDSFSGVPAAVLNLARMRRLSSLCVAARTSTGVDGEHGFDTLLELGLSESVRSLSLCGYYLVDFQALPHLRTFGVEAGHLDQGPFRAQHSAVISRQRASPAAYRDLLTHALERGVEELFLPQTYEQIPKWDGVEAVDDAGAPAVEIPLPGDALRNLRVFHACDLSMLPIEPAANCAGLAIHLTPTFSVQSASNSEEISRLRHLQERPDSVTLVASIEELVSDDPDDAFYHSDFFRPGYLESIHAALAHLEGGSTRVSVSHRSIGTRTGRWLIPIHISNNIGDLSESAECTLQECKTLERCFEPLEYTPGRCPDSWYRWAGPSADEAKVCRLLMFHVGPDRAELEGRMAAAGVAVLPAWWGSIWPEGDEGAGEIGAPSNGVADDFWNPLGAE